MTYYVIKLSYIQPINNDITIWSQDIPEFKLVGSDPDLLMSQIIPTLSPMVAKLLNRSSVTITPLAPISQYLKPVKPLSEEVGHISYYIEADTPKKLTRFGFVIILAKYIYTHPKGYDDEKWKIALSHSANLLQQYEKEHHPFGDPSHIWNEDLAKLIAKIYKPR